jgi:hypothetical protein
MDTMRSKLPARGGEKESSARLAVTTVRLVMPRSAARASMNSFCVRLLETTVTLALG